MRLQLFDDQDLKQIEDAVARAVTRGLVSGIKAIIERGYLQGLQAAAPELRPAERIAEPATAYWEKLAEAQPISRAPEPPRPAEQPAAPVEAREAPASPQEAPQPAPPVPVQPTARDEEPPELAAPRPEKSAPRFVTVAQTEKPPRKKRQAIDLRKFIRIVPARPEGYITTDEALRQNLVGGPPDSAAVQLRLWITSRQVDAVIVHGYGTPTKGLPGRLCVSKASVIAREQRRAANAASGKGQYIRRGREEHAAA